MKKGERTRHTIIKHAATLFNERGVAGTTIEDILIASKVAKGSLYSLFENKEDLAYEAVDYLMHRLSAKTAALLGAEKTGFGKLCALIDLYQNPLHPYIKGGCPMLNFGVEADDTDPVICGKVRDMILRVKSLLVSIMEQGIESGEFSIDLHPKQFALKIFAMLEGGLLISRALNDNRPAGELNKMLKKELKRYREK